MIAFAARRQLRLLDLATCRTRVLAGVDATDVRFSADGRWLAYSRGRGNLGTASSASAGLFVVSVDGGQVRTPLGRNVVAWSWAPRRDLLYGLTDQGTLVSAAPTGRRRVITSHLGGGALAAFPALGISRDARQAVVDRSNCGTSPVGELVRIDLATGARRVVVRRAGAPVVFAGLSPQGGWLLFWPDEMCSASLAADGMALEAVRATGEQPARAIGHMLLYRDFMTWCGRRLIAAAGSSRETQLGSRLVMTAPAAWRPHTIDPAHTRSWVSPSCAPSGGQLAAAAGPDNAPVAFGHQHRSIWLLQPDGTPIRRLTRPPAADLSDESPRFSTDGRWLLFVRSRGVPLGRSAFSKDTIEMVPADGTANAVSLAAFTSSDASYYDHFDWPDQIAWHQPPPQTIRVPRVTGVDLSHAYARLHAAGLRVSYPHHFSDGSFDCEPTIGTQHPAAGRTVPSATTVTLAPQRSFCGLGSPGVPNGRLPSATVPRFIGRTVLTASRWAEYHRLYWQADSLPALRNADADTLLANYTIRSQAPHPGQTLKLGIGHKLGKNAGSFSPRHWCSTPPSGDTPPTTRCRQPPAVAHPPCRSRSTAANTYRSISAADAGSSPSERAHVATRRVESDSRWRLAA